MCLVAAPGVSEAVLEGISRALQLDDAERPHLHDLVRTGIKAIHHPVVGDLDLSYEAMDLTSDRGLLLLAYTAAPGSPSDDALRVRPVRGCGALRPRTWPKR
jgi:MmyB-like transcription regulator ligand binding domain